MGRIYEVRRGPEAYRWFWSLHGIFGKPSGLRTDGRAPTLDEVKTQFEASWRQWLAGAKLQEKASKVLMYVCIHGPSNAGWAQICPRSCKPVRHRPAAFAFSQSQLPFGPSARAIADLARW